MAETLSFVQKVARYQRRFGWRALVGHVVQELMNRPIRYWVCWKKFGRHMPAKAIVFQDAYVHGAKYMDIGEGFHAGPHMWLEALDVYTAAEGVQHFKPRLVIGRGVSFSWFGHIGCVNHIEIGDNVLFGSRCYVTDHNHGVYNGEQPDAPDSIPGKRHLTEDGEVIIGDCCWIGDNVVILPGVHIGKGVIIGANSVVTHDIPEATIAVGSPARPIKRWDEERRVWVRIGK